MNERDQTYMAVVRRDRPEVFEALRAHPGERNLVDVIWDRRFWERRRGLPKRRRERRQSDRRRPVPRTWDTAGYVLVPPTGALGPGVMRA